MEVLSAPTVAVWICPDCGHGSPERRDERAHLDAHRQLRAFFDEWDAGVGGAGPSRSSRSSALLGTVLAAIVLLASVGVFARVNAPDDSLRRSAQTGPVPGVLAPTTDVPRAPKAPVAVPVPAAAAASPVAPATASLVDPAPAVQAPSLPLAPEPTPAPAPPIAAPVAVPPQPAPHLLRICLLDVCLTI